jgi:hypothetical protein
MWFNNLSSGYYSHIEFIQDIGIPSEMHNDDAKEQTLGKWKQTMQKFQIKQTLSQPYSPWQVRPERCICEIKKSVQRLMDNTKAPKCLWDYCAVSFCTPSLCLARTNTL